eukprot:m.73166 g.73166  ORF g.73166 m.73166 type:complete len:457 (+) comp14312_c0_seq1:93-1463(+)
MAMAPTPNRTTSYASRHNSYGGSRILPTRLTPPEPTLNPFADPTADPSAYDWFKICVTGLILLPLRLLLVAICLLIANLWAFIFSIGITIDVKHPENIPAWRSRLVQPVASFLARVILFSLGFYWIKVKGTQADPKIAPIAVSNHMSYFEPFALVAMGHAHVAKYQVAHLWYWRLPLAFLQTVAVVRESKQSSTDALNAIINHATKCQSATADDHVLPLMIYPEGTTGIGTSLLQFKPGAFAPGVPVQPVIIRQPWTFFCPTEQFQTRMWFLRAYSQYAMFMEIEYLPVIYPTGAEKADPYLYADRVRRLMARTLNIATSGYAVNDLLLQYAAKNHGFPPLVGAVEWGLFYDTFKVKKEFALGVLDVFAQLNTTRTGFLTVAQLKDGLKQAGVVIEQGDIEYLFPNTRDSLTYREFLYLICDKHEPLDQLKIVSRQPHVEALQDPLKAAMARKKKE